MIKFKKGDNLRFIANYLFENPGSRYTHIIRALCEYRGKMYNRGMYSEYFRGESPPWKRNGYGATHWKKAMGVWWLRPAGLCLVDLRDS